MRLLSPAVAAALLALGAPALAGVDDAVHKKCLEARDYKGCVEAFQGPAKQVEASIGGMKPVAQSEFFGIELKGCEDTGSTSLKWVLSRVLEGSNAEKLGLEVGDEVVQINGYQLSDIQTSADSADFSKKVRTASSASLILRQPDGDEYLQTKLQADTYPAVGLPTVEEFRRSGYSVNKKLISAMPGYVQCRKAIRLFPGRAYSSEAAHLVEPYTDEWYSIAEKVRPPGSPHFSSHPVAGSGGRPSSNRRRNNFGTVLQNVGNSMQQHQRQMFESEMNHSREMQRIYDSNRPRHCSGTINGGFVDATCY